MYVGTEATISCTVQLFGLTRELDNIHWEKEDGTVITSEMTDYDVVVGSYDTETNTQTSTLTVKEGVSTVDTTYTCAVTRGEGVTKSPVYLRVFSKCTPYFHPIEQRSMSNIFSKSRFNG